MCDIPQNKAPRTGPHHIWCTVCPFFSHEKNTDGSAVGFAGQCLLWRLLLRLAAAAAVVVVVVVVVVAAAAVLLLILPPTSLQHR